MDMDIVNKIIDLTNTTIDNWANKYWGYVPNNVSRELDKVYFDRIKSFTVELNPMHKKAIAEIDTD